MSLPTRIRVSAKAIIEHEGKFLVVSERVLRDGKPAIMDDFPGGGLENNETLEQALLREVWEEVGLSVKIERPVGSWEFMFNKPQERVHLICVAFHCSLVGSAEIDISKNPAVEDIFEARWLTKEEVLALKGFETDTTLQTFLNVVAR